MSLICQYNLKGLIIITTDCFNQLEEAKPTWGKRKLMNHALIPTMFTLIKKEVEDSEEEALKELYVAAFK